VALKGFAGSTKSERVFRIVVVLATMFAPAAQAHAATTSDMSLTQQFLHDVGGTPTSFCHVLRDVSHSGWNRQLRSCHVVQRPDLGLLSIMGAYR
jgi:hypothetical protein